MILNLKLQFSKSLCLQQTNFKMCIKNSKPSCTVQTPFVCPFLILRILGLWIDGSASDLYCFYGLVLHVFTTVGFTLILAVYFVQMVQQGNVLEMADALNVLLTSFGVSVKAIWFVVEVKKIQKMKKKLEELLKLKIGGKFIEVRVNQVLKMTKFFYFSGFISTLAAFIQFCFKHSNKELPYKGWFYWDYRTNDSLLWSLAVYQYVGSVYGFLSNFSLDAIPMIFISLTTAAIDELCEEISLMEQKRHRSSWKLENCIRTHVKLKDFVSEISNELSIPFLTQIFLSSVILCTSTVLLTTVSMFAIVLQSNVVLIFPQISPVSEPVVFFRTLAYATTMLIQIFLPCYFGNELSLASDKISISLFYSCWISKDVDNKRLTKIVLKKPETSSKRSKKLLSINPPSSRQHNDDKRFKTAVKIFMENSKKCLKVRAVNLFIMNYESFISICNFAYSLYAVFKKVKQT
jgi:odorant receptor